MYFLHTLVIAVSIFGAASIAQQSTYAPAGTHDEPSPPALVLEYENGDTEIRPETPILQFTAPREQIRESRRCMTVCSRWGEDCVMLNPGTDLVSKKCVRTCKSFAEECL